MLQTPDVDQLLNGELGRWLASQQQRRDEAKRKINRGIMIAAGVTLLALLIALAAGASTSILFIIACFGVAGGGGYAQMVRDPIVADLKSQMNGAIAQSVGLTYSMSGEPGDYWPWLRGLSMLPDYDEDHYEDFWGGEIKNYEMRLFESVLQEWQKSGKERTLVTVFRGVIVEIGYGRQFRGTTLIERKGTRAKFFGLRDSISAMGKTLEHVSFSNPDLERSFDLWSSDPVEAHYLVHPIYVERLVEVEQRYRGMDVRALFHGGKMIAVIETKAQFESGALDSAQDRKNMEETVRQFMAIAGLADSLYDEPGKLNR